MRLARSLAALAGLTSPNLSSFSRIKTEVTFTLLGTLNAWNASQLYEGIIKIKEKHCKLFEVSDSFEG